LSPFVKKIENEQAPENGIAVFTCQVLPAVQCAWFIGDKKIVRENFRFGIKLFKFWIVIKTK
jgi:hypothetical protein